jgi:hypothetical protein
MVVLDLLENFNRLARRINLGRRLREKRLLPPQFRQPDLQNLSGDCVISSPRAAFWRNCRAQREMGMFALGNFSSFKNFTKPRISATARWSAVVELRAQGRVLEFLERLHQILFQKIRRAVAHFNGRFHPRFGQRILQIGAPAATTLGA